MTIPVADPDTVASAAAYQAIIDTYRNADRPDLADMVRHLPNDRLRRLRRACCQLGSLVEAETQRRHAADRARSSG
jgi:hypothetical protein